MSALTPIALFAYNRPDHTQRLFQSLIGCEGLSDCALHIYCDGPREIRHLEAVDAARKVVRDWADRLKARVVLRTDNLGLSRSITAGVTELCEERDRVIILEDDFVLAPDFLIFMLDALTRYAEAEPVYQVSGHMFPVGHPATPDALFLPLTTTWGWATWRRAWRQFSSEEGEARATLSDPQRRRQFDLGGAYSFSSMLEASLAGKIDSWGIHWWHSVFRRKGLAVYPRRSLVWNGGFDDSGRHCGKGDVLGDRLPDDFGRARLSSPLVWPEHVEADHPAFQRVVTFLKNRPIHSTSPSTSLWDRLGARWFRRTGRA